MLQKVKEFNNISKETLGKIPAMPRVVVYEMLNGSYDAISKRMHFGGAVELPGRDTIIDNDTPVNIGVPRKIENGEVKKVESFLLGGGGEPVPSRFELNADNVSHRIWYHFFSLCNYNESNVNADPSVKKLIRQVDSVVDAKTYNKKRNALKDALILADAMDLDSAKMLAASLNMEYDVDGGRITKDELFAEIGKYAEQSPAEFVLRVNDDKTKTRAEIKLALDKGVIAFDAVSRKVTLVGSGKLIATLEKDDEKEWNELLCEYLLTSKSGSETLSYLRKAVANKLKNKETAE